MIVLFVLSILGCPAPIVAVAAPWYVVLKRKTIAKAGPAYLVMGYSAIAVSALYSILLLLFRRLFTDGNGCGSVDGEVWRPAIVIKSLHLCPDGRG